MELRGSTQHELKLKVSLIPVGEVSQGRALTYQCRACGERLVLLDPLRRGWFVCSVLVGLALCGLGAFFATVRHGALAMGLLLLGAAVSGGFGALLLREVLRLRRAPPVD